MAIHWQRPAGQAEALMRDGAPPGRLSTAGAQGAWGHSGGAHLGTLPPSAPQERQVRPEGGS